VDPLLASGKSADPQTFNRYAYTMNRPLILTDPTGLQVGRQVESRTDESNMEHSLVGPDPPPTWFARPEVSVTPGVVRDEVVPGFFSDEPVHVRTFGVNIALKLVDRSSSSVWYGFDFELESDDPTAPLVEHDSGSVDA